MAVRFCQFTGRSHLFLGSGRTLPPRRRLRRTDRRFPVRDRGLNKPPKRRLRDGILLVRRSTPPRSITPRWSVWNRGVTAVVRRAGSQASSSPRWQRPRADLEHGFQMLGSQPAFQTLAAIAKWQSVWRSGPRTKRTFIWPARLQSPTTGTDPRRSPPRALSPRCARAPVPCPL